MKTTQPSNVRTRAEILASIANLPDSVQGSISSYKITTVTNGDSPQAGEIVGTVPKRVK